MGLAQMSALGGGRGFRRPYVAEINARKKFLPQLYAEKKRQEQSDRMWGLQQRGLAQEKKLGLANLDIQKDIAHEARKRNKLAQNLGFANLGLSGAMGAYDIAGQPSLSDFSDWFSSDQPDMSYTEGFDMANAMAGGVMSGDGGGDDIWSSGIDWLMEGLF